ncbi:TPA: hypothetical protein ACH3X2_012065 [Trebouxia sp. C0005]
MLTPVSIAADLEAWVNITKLLGFSHPHERQLAKRPVQDQILFGSVWHPSNSPDKAEVYHMRRYSYGAIN